MKALIAEALDKNFDVRIAAQRVFQQQAQAGIARAEALPSVSGGAAYSAVGLPAGLLGGTSSPSFHGGGFTASAAWNLDFWGLYRRQNEAARAQLLATEWGRRAIVSSVVIQVAASYLQMRTLDAQLDLTRRTLESRRESLRLVNLRETVGSTTMVDVHQAEQLLYAAEAVVPDLERRIREQENDLSLLMGRNPGTIPRGNTTAAQPHPRAVPAGLPSELLERRPDIQRAEARLIAANAQIGVARARYFPQISLTGLGGSATGQLSMLFSSASMYWLAAGNVSLPIFTGGKLKNNLKSAEAVREEMLLAYQQTIATAFHDVANALIAYQKSTEYRIAQQMQVTAATESVRLARLRYENGRTSYLEVLTNDTNLFAAEIRLAGAQEPEALSLVQLYGALGGGWQ